MAKTPQTDLAAQVAQLDRLVAQASELSTHLVGVKDTLAQIRDELSNKLTSSQKLNQNPACISCGTPTRFTRTRQAEPSLGEAFSVERWYACTNEKCSIEFSTIELYKITTVPKLVSKSDGRTEPFSLEKLALGIHRADTRIDLRSSIGLAKKVHATLADKPNKKENRQICSSTDIGEGTLKILWQEGHIIAFFRFVLVFRKKAYQQSETFENLVNLLFQERKRSQINLEQFENSLEENT